MPKAVSTLHTAADFSAGMWYSGAGISQLRGQLFVSHCFLQGACSAGAVGVSGSASVSRMWIPGLSDIMGGLFPSSFHIFACVAFCPVCRWHFLSFLPWHGNCFRHGQVDALSDVLTRSSACHRCRSMRCLLACLEAFCSHGFVMQGRLGRLVSFRGAGGFDHSARLCMLLDTEAFPCPLT